MSQDAKQTSADLDRWSEALSWHATLSEGRDEDLTSAVGRRWQDWYADPENRRAFEAVSKLLADRGRYRQRRRPTKAELEADEYDLSIPIAEWRKRQALDEVVSGKSKSLATTGFRWRWAMGGIAVAAAAAIAALAPMWPLRFASGSGPSVPAVYQTGTGVIKDVHLRDGSTIVMGARTRLAVAYSTRRRAVNLIEGQAWFKAVHNPRWPFVVRAGGGTITAAGTAFVVTRYSDRIVVAVTEGTVVVKARTTGPSFQSLAQGGISKPALTPIHVSQGNQLVFRESGAVGRIKPTDTYVATAWTQGRLIFDNQPLRDVVEAVNRYSPRPIVVSPEAGALRFGGVVHGDEIEDWLKSLEVIFPVTIEERAGTTYIRMRKSKADGPKLPHTPQY